MNATAAWSTHAAPLAGVVGAVVLTLGVFSLVTAAVTLALGGAAWNLPAYACLVLAACLVALRLYRDCRQAVQTLNWDPAQREFRLAGTTDRLTLLRVGSGPAWVTLVFHAHSAPGRLVRLVLWKSVIPAPSWSELALCIEAVQVRGECHQNKENP